MIAIVRQAHGPILFRGTLADARRFLLMHTYPPGLLFEVKP